MAKILKPMKKSAVKVFRIKNRRGYAAICKEHLTEGRSVVQTLQRMQKALKRSGYLLKV